MEPREPRRPRNRITEQLPAHGSRLFTVTPHGRPGRPTTASYEAEAPGNTLTGNASLADCGACSGGRKAGNLYLGGALRFNDVVVKKSGTYLVKVAYVSGDTRTVQRLRQQRRRHRTQVPLHG